MNKLRSFTLIEVVIVVIIIGFLATLALPRIMAQVEAVKAVEALNIFGTIKRAANECMEFSSINEFDDCFTASELNISLPSTDLTAFSYTCQVDFDGILHIKALRNPRPGTDPTDAICYDLEFQKKPVFGVAGTAFLGLIKRTAYSSGTEISADCDTEPYETSLQ